SPMLLLRRPRLRVFGVSCIGHRVFPFLRQAEVALGLCLLFGCRKLCHLHDLHVEFRARIVPWLEVVDNDPGTTHQPTEGILHIMMAIRMSATPTSRKALRIVRGTAEYSGAVPSFRLTVSTNH